MRIHCLQHVPFEGPANIAAWAKARGHGFQATELFQNRPLPGRDELDWLVVMGGPMSVHDEARYPRLSAEKKLIERAVKANKLVLGVCLGAQLLADVLGARVYRNKHKEIGWFPVRRSAAAVDSPVFGCLPAEFTAFHWHGETFDLPPGALHLAESDACRNQAFEYGCAWGLQFHLESTPESAADLIRHCAGDIGQGPFEQQPEEMLRASGSFAALQPLLFGLLDRMAERAERR